MVSSKAYRAYVISGVVDAEGKTISGKGFEVRKVGTGDYDVHFQPPLPSPPGVTATIFGNGRLGYDGTVIWYVDEYYTKIRTGNSRNEWEDMGFSFIAAGMEDVISP